MAPNLTWSDGYTVDGGDSCSQVILKGATVPAAQRYKLYVYTAALSDRCCDNGQAFLAWSAVSLLHRADDDD